jgi:hypothetical protein
MIQLHNPTTLLPMTPAERVRWCSAEMRLLETDMAEASTYREWMPLARALILVRREYYRAWLQWTAEQAAQHAADRARGFEHCQAAVARFHSSEHSA